MMKNSASVKAAILIGIALLLLIPLSLLQNLVAERVSHAIRPSRPLPIVGATANGSVVQLLPSL
jgi:hypothetical protein